MIYATIVGRLREDLKRFGTEAIGYIGKHIVGTGEDAHLTTKVFIDFLKSHVILICGKRGSGKSYCAATILEEFLLLREEYRNKISFVVVDPMGIYWSMKFPNKAQIHLLKEWNIEPVGFENVKVFVPIYLKEAYQKANIPVDGVVAIAPNEVSVDEWLLAFGLSPVEPLGIAFQKNYNEIIKEKINFDIQDLIEKIEKDEEIKVEYRTALINLLKVVMGWGIFSKVGLKINELVAPGKVIVIDVSRMPSAGVRNLLVALLARKIYNARVTARKEEEIARMEGRQPSLTFPLVWLVLEEAHNFIPTDTQVASTEPILTLAKQGREPGISLVCITQMPNKVHQDVLSQCDLVISFRLTSKADLDALHTVYQTYMAEEIEALINKLPRWPGSACIFDDNLEKVFTVCIRPRLSHHAGATAALI
jgi:DNA helicase HerA-like ATPase